MTNWRQIGGLVLIAMLTASCSRSTTVPVENPKESSGTSVPQTHETGKRRIALLIGINHYKYISSLDGALNDIDDMKKVLTSREYGFKDGDDIHMLRNEQATRRNILKEIDDHLISKAGPGDIVVFHYSGHGSTLDDPSDPSGFDNTIVPYDSRDPAKSIWDIRDKELNVRLRRLSDKVGDKGGITFILDSCHSGTGLKAAGKIRSAPPDTRFGKNPPPLDLAGSQPGTRDSSGSGYSDQGINYVLIAGSRTDQVSFERVGHDFQTNGALTHYLIEELLKPTPVKRTYRDVMNKVVSAVRGEFPSQTPQLEGNNVDQVVFGDESIQTRNYVLANPSDNNQVQLQGGHLQEFTVGSVFDIYAQDAHRFEPPEQPIARISLTSVDEFQSTGKITWGKQIPMGSKAVEREHSFAAEKTQILLEGPPQSPPLSRIRAVLVQHPAHPFQIVSEGQSFQVRIAQLGGQIRTFGPDGLELSIGIPVNDPQLVARIERRILDWARWFGLLRLRNPSSTVRAEFTLVPRNQVSTTRPGQFFGFTPGDKRFDLRVKNLTSTGLFVYVLDITSLGKVRQVYPDPGSTVPLAPGREMPINDWGVSLPPNTSHVRDVFKLIVTTTEVDLRYLQMDAPRGIDKTKAPEPPNDPLNRLIFESSVGARDASRKVADDWNTADVAFEVCGQASTGGCKP